MVVLCTAYKFFLLDLDSILLFTWWSALSGSLWTRMLQEVFKITLKTPDTFISGFTILSELLPLPLPIHSQEVILQAISVTVSQAYF